MFSITWKLHVHTHTTSIKNFPFPTAKPIHRLKQLDPHLPRMQDKTVFCIKHMVNIYSVHVT